MEKNQVSCEQLLDLSNKTKANIELIKSLKPPATKVSKLGDLVYLGLRTDELKQSILKIQTECTDDKLFVISQPTAQVESLPSVKTDTTTFMNKLESMRAELVTTGNEVRSIYNSIIDLK